MAQNKHRNVPLFGCEDAKMPSNPKIIGLLRTIQTKRPPIEATSYMTSALVVTPRNLPPDDSKVPCTHLIGKTYLIWGIDIPLNTEFCSLLQEFLLNGCNQNCKQHD